MATILVVDDEEDLCVYFTAMLSRAGHSVLVASDIGHVFQMLEGGYSPDVLLTDNNLWNGQTGAALIRQLRERSLCPRGVILMSGRQEAEKAAEELGVAFAAKPIDSQGMLALIASILEPT